MQQLRQETLKGLIKDIREIFESDPLIAERMLKELRVQIPYLPIRKASNGQISYKDVQGC